MGKCLKFCTHLSPLALTTLSLYFKIIENIFIAMLFYSPRNTGPLPPLSWNGKMKVSQTFHFCSTVFIILLCVKNFEQTKFKEYILYCSYVSDPDPGPGSRIQGFFEPCIRDPDPGSGME
jgi:hypothetical protein